MYVDFEIAALFPSPYSRVKKCGNFKTNINLDSVESFLYHLSSNIDTICILYIHKSRVTKIFILDAFQAIKTMYLFILYFENHKSQPLTKRIDVNIRTIRQTIIIMQLILRNFKWKAFIAFWQCTQLMIHNSCMSTFDND